MSHRLKIVAEEERKTAPPPPISRRTETQAQFERQWRHSPEQFDSHRNVIERLRITRTLALIDEQALPESSNAVDLGCGSGQLSRALTKRGIDVTAVDCASQPLAALRHGIDAPAAVKQDYIPKTLLDDNSFDLVLATDLIEYLPATEYRLFFAEVARLVKSDGYVVCSTAIDILSDDALARFAALAETELNILHWRFSYHALYIRLRNVFKAPARYARSWRDSRYRIEQLERRRSLARRWFQFNSSKLVAPLWWLLQLFTTPCVTFIEQSRFLLTTLEKVSRILSQEEGISHAIFIAKRRQLLPPTDQPLQPQERKHKKQVWE